MIGVETIKIKFRGEGPLESIRFRIIELPDEACLQSMKSGAPITIRGGPDDESIMMIGQTTLRLRELCTSNNFLLVNRETGFIEETTQSIIEAMPIKGMTGRLVSLLRDNAYEGPLGPDKEVSEFLREDKLNGYIQASDDEISLNLKKCKAILIKGYWRILGPSYICRFFELFFTSALLEDWPVTTGILSRSAVKRKFQEEFEDEFSQSSLLENIFDLFQEIDDQRDNEDEWKVSELLVCRFFGDQLLRAKTQWDSEDFIEAWLKLVGEFTPKLEMLKGLALFEVLPTSLPNHYRLKSFPVSDLPPLPVDRFSLLFQTRSRWYYDDLIPFLDGLEESEKKLQGLLIKFARLSTEAATGRKVVTPLLPPP